MASQAVIQPLSKGGIAFFSSLCIGTFGLGSWQAKRYFEKIELVQLRHNELQMVPISLGDNVYCSLEERIVGVDVDVDVDNNAKGEMIIPSNSIIAKEEDDTKRGFRTVTTKGRFMHEYEILVGPRGPPPGAISNSGPNSGRSSGGMSSSPQGYYVITPFHRSSSSTTNTTTTTTTNTTASTVLVNRGWVPRQYVQQNAAWDRPDGIVNIVGVMSKTEQPKFFSPPHSAKDPNQLLWMDRQAMEEKTNTIGLSPLLLTQTDTTSTPSTKDSITNFPVKPSKETVGEFKVLPSTHAGYAFTWFGLSSAGIFMTRKLITRGRA